MWTNILLLLLVAVVSLCVGFQCHVCSYSVNTDKNRDCIDALDTLTDPTNYFTCNRTCTIQENYSLELKKVTSYFRTCSVMTKSGYCVKDTWNLVCFFSCTGELCNNYQGELHAVLPVQDPRVDSSDDTGIDNNGSSCVSRDFRFIVWTLLIFGFVCTLS